MSKVTELARAQLTPSPHNTVTVELIEADETPAVVIVTWPQRRPCYTRNASPTWLPRSRDCSPAPLLNWHRSSQGGSYDPP